FVRDNGFSAAMNYRGFAIPVKGWLVDGRISASGFADLLARERGSRDEMSARVLQNLVDSHDTQRIASAIANRDRSGPYEAADWFDYDAGGRVGARSPGYRTGAPDADGRRLWKMIAWFQATYVG